MDIPSRRVLVIDDSPLALAVVREALEGAGFVVETAPDGPEGLEKLGPFDPQVVVSDLMMPKMSGIEVVKAVRERAPGTAILIFTDLSAVNLAVEAMQDGAFGYMVKDASAAALVSEVTRAFDHAQTLARNRKLEEENRRYQQELERMVAEKTAELIQVHEAKAREVQAKADALARLEESFRSLIDRSPEPIAIERGARVIHANPSLLGLLGLADLSQAAGRAIADWVHPADRDLFVERMAQAVDAATGRISETRWQRSDGATLTVEVLPLPIFFEGEPATMCLTRDLTERKQLTAKMMQLDRMIAVGTLAAGVGHEINNPLSYVVGNLSYVDRKLEGLIPAARAQEEGPPAEGARLLSAELAEVKEVLSEAMTGAERVREVVRDLKTFSRGDDAALEPVDVRSAIDSAINMARAEIRPRAQLVKQYEDELPLVNGNESKLGQVVLNLLINAAHAIPEGAAHQNEIRVRSFRRDAKVGIEVKDSGSGIPPENLARIFDPFYTTKPVGQGTGLGLSICLNIIRTFGGEIEVESEIGKGTAIRVWLPVAKVESPAAQPEGAVQAAPRRGRVLVIDDEPNVLRAVKRALEREHEVVLAEQARSALAMLTGGEAFDVIIADLLMPDMTGMDLYDTLAAAHPQLARRMMFLTGGGFTPRAQEFIGRVSGSNKVMAKPFNIEELRAAVAAGLD